MFVFRFVTKWTAIPGLALVVAAGCGEAASSSGAADAPSVDAVDAVPTLSGSFGGSNGGANANANASTPACGGASAAQSPFTGALCTCHDANIQGYLRTRAFNSSQGPYNPGANGGGGAVGINHDYVISAAGANAGFTDIGGSFQVAGGATGFNGFLNVNGDLLSAGTVDVKGYTRVDRDAWMGGDFLNTGFAQIGRDLHIKGHDMLPAFVSGARYPGPVTVKEPCACAPSQLLAVGAMVAAGKGSNDNSVLHLDPGVWSSAIGDLSLTLPAGRYYLDGIRAIGNIELHVTGQVALFVGGDVAPTGRFAIDLAPAAQIDLYVAGDLQLTGYAPLGDPSRPAATRIYVAGQRDIDLTGFQSFVGNLYAPGARVISRGFVDVWGSFFVRDLEVAGYASFVHDLAVSGPLGGGCTPPPPKGAPCGAFTCPTGQACVAGVCGECGSDADCSGQLVCKTGRCVPLLH